MIEGRLPPGGAGPAEILLHESRQEIASRLSMKPETLSRILRALSEGGAIEVDGRTLRVPDRARLLAFLDSSN
jgi:CRP-like cAMP-binding protein